MTDGQPSTKAAAQLSFADELGNHLGSIVPNLVRWRDELWFAKVPHGASWPEVLAYQLGRGRLNVAAVALPQELTGATWVQSGASFEPQEQSDRILIRLAQDYSLGELPLKDNDQAIATELAYSLWIRRRDAHAENRAYVEGVPIFFDHHIAFGVEAENVPIGSFLRAGGDAGYVGRWRVRDAPSGTNLTTKGERTISAGDLAIHRIHHRDDFDRHINTAAELIKAFTNAEIESCVSRSAAPPAVVGLLQTNRDNLKAELEQLRRILALRDPGA